MKWILNCDVTYLRTDGHLEDDDDGENSPYGMTAEVLKRLFQENEERQESESQTHFRREYKSYSIRRSEFPKSDQLGFRISAASTYPRSHVATTIGTVNIAGVGQKIRVHI